MGGYWVMIEFQTEASKEKFKANIGIGSWFSQLEQASNLFHIDERVTWVDIEGISLKDEGKVLWVRAKEVFGWIPDFVEDDEQGSDTNDEIRDEDLHDESVCMHNHAIVEGESDVEEASETIFENKQYQAHKKDDLNVGQNDIRSEDPFSIYDLLNKKQDNNIRGYSSDNMKHPPVFTPTVAIEVQSNAFKESGMKGDQCLQNIHDEKVASEVKKTYPLSNLKEDREGSICLVPLLVIRVVPNGKKLLIILVYTLQELNKKKMLWDYLTLMIDNWNGEVVIRGDFNEVRKQAKRYDSIFNVQGAGAFNSFISTACLEEVPLGGCSFTWCHKSSTKMSKLDHFLISEGLMGSCPNISAITLDHYLSNHRPILMRESHFDYGPIPFCFFHYWFEMEGFDKFVETTWNDAHVTDSNDMTKLIKKMKYLKEKIRAWIKVKKDSSKNYKKTLKMKLAEIDLLLDKGEGNSDVLNKRISISKSLQELDKLESMEVAQKAKIKGAIEGDKNSKYYHGILNNKEANLLFVVSW
ncbi:RNA-directed DNA polymerase, eukaryota, reverse transcriptase zinc-binding domain protein [Tanacetum coccineum]